MNQNDECGTVLDESTAFAVAVMAGVPFSTSVDENGIVTFTLKQKVHVEIDQGKINVFAAKE